LQLFYSIVNNTDADYLFRLIPPTIQSIMFSVYIEEWNKE
jgi:hypothetical protein